MNWIKEKIGGWLGLRSMNYEIEEIKWSSRDLERQIHELDKKLKAKCCGVSRKPKVIKK